MRLILRIVGTGLIGLAFVLLVVDGTKSLAANGMVFTTLGDAWNDLHSASLADVPVLLDGWLLGELFDQVLNGMLAWPAFAVAGIPGFALLLAGRVPQRERFLRQDQI